MSVIVEVVGCRFDRTGEDVRESNGSSSMGIVLSSSIVLVDTSSIVVVVLGIVGTSSVVVVVGIGEDVGESKNI